MTTATDFLAAFTSATETPVTGDIEWPKKLAIDHPVRQLRLKVRYWPVEVALYMQSLAEKNEKGWLSSSYWYVIAASICKPDGTLAFADNWKTLYEADLKDKQDAYEAALAEWSMQPPAMQQALARPAPPQWLKDENGRPILPPPDFHIIGEWLKSKWDTPQGGALMRPMWETAMNYNGWTAGESKNSETTASTEQSGEKPTVAE